MRRFGGIFLTIGDRWAHLWHKQQCPEISAPALGGDIGRDLSADLDPNDPVFGRVVDKATHDAWHNGKDIAHGGAFNAVWDEFFAQYPEATAQQILGKLEEIRSGHIYEVTVKDGTTKSFSFGQ